MVAGQLGVGRLAWAGGGGVPVERSIVVSVGAMILVLRSSGKKCVLFAAMIHAELLLFSPLGLS